MEKLGKEAVRLRGLSRWTSVIAAALLLIAGPASATLVAVGDPFDTGSWAQWFRENNVTFDHVQLLMATDRASFESISRFANADGTTNADWQGYISGDHLLLWADGGTPVNWLEFLVTFAGASSDPLTFHFQAYNDSSQVANADARWIPLGMAGWWDIHTGTWGEKEPVPEPISMVMLGCVGAGMFAARKLRGKRAT